MSRPRALAVCRLMTNSNLVDCKTGGSTGFNEFGRLGGLVSKFNVFADRLTP
jgi:hypothetical protein